MRQLLQQTYPGTKVILNDIFKPALGDYETHQEDILSHYPDVRNTAHSANISSIRRVASFDLDKQLEVFDITLSQNARINYSRVNIQRAVRSVMDVYSGALMFFHYEDNQGEWRISFAEKDSSQSSTTPAKRYTYLLGENHSSRTLNGRLDKLQEKSEKSLDAIRDAFSVEKLSDEFFERYKSIYADFVEFISGKRFVKSGSKWEERVTGMPNAQFETVFENDDKLVRDYVKKLLGRVVFLYFIQKKGWMGVSVDSEVWEGGDTNFLHTLFKKATPEQQNNFLEAVLEPIFFKCLNEIRTNEVFDTGVGGVGVAGKVKIPYLNGGLFEDDDLDKLSVSFPKEKFEKLFNFFSQYNFTIDENDPDDAEVGVDPEMLGKIFENLLEDNKDKGAFYTPKEIVQYMCRESLVAYLNEKIPEQGSSVRQLVQEHKASDSWNEATKQKALQLLKDVKVCDPAIGSGAFPMGMLNELYKCRLALGETKSAEIKKHIIQNNIYGVDIESGAVDIARLRFWLSLVVDEENPHPLPNLDYKIMQGNSLLESYEGFDLSQLTSTKEKIAKKHQGMYSLAFDESKTASNIKMLTKEYFDVTDHARKNEIRRLIDEQVKQHIILCGGSTPEIIEKVNNLDFNNKPFFLWHTYFADVFDAEKSATDCNTGFDIVLGNPPYNELRDLTFDNQNLYKKSNYHSFAKGGRINMFQYFYPLGLDITSKNGIVCLITQNSILAEDSALNNRKLLLEQSEIIQIDSFPERDNVKTRVFESVKMSVCTCLLKKKKIVDNRFRVNVWTDRYMSNKHFLDISRNEIIAIYPEDLIIPICDNKKFEILLKLKERCFFKINAQAGEIDMTKYKSKFTSNSKDKRVITGAQVLRYRITDTPSQGKINYISSENIELTEGRLNAIAQERIVLQRITGVDSLIRIIATILPPNYLCANSTNYISPINNTISLYFLLGVLNSKCINFLFKQTSTNTNVTGKEISNFPISNATTNQQNNIITLVNQILSLKQENPQADTVELENQIDVLVYKLYDLSYDEVKIIDPAFQLSEVEYDAIK